MADSFSYNNNNKPPRFPPPPTPLTRDKELLLHSTRTRRSYSYTRFIRKFLFFAFFLIALPLFPSKAPEFVDKTILTNFWELVHLLFIGVAVSYGLSSRRNVGEMDHTIETPSQSHFYDSQSYGSSLFHSTSYFDGGCENPYGYWGRNGYGGESMLAVNNGSYYALNGYAYAKPGLGNFENGYGNPVGFQDQNVIQAWNSQYYQGQSMVMVANGNCVVDEHRMPRSMVGYQPLGLPVRSLKLRSEHPESHELSDVSESGSSSSSSSSSANSPNREFGDLGAQNLEGNFKVTVNKPSSIPWRSRSVRMGMRENMGTAARPSHFRPLSVDEIQFELLKSRSFQYNGSSLSQDISMQTEIRENVNLAAQPSHFTPLSVDETQFESFSDSFKSKGSLSSQGSPVSYSPSRLSPSHSVSPELPNSNVEEMGRQKSFRQPYPPPSTSAAAMNNNKVKLREGAGTSTHPSHFRPLSVDETQFESLKSQSSRSTGSSSSSKCSSTSYSPSRLSPSHTASPELPKLKAEEVQKEKSFLGLHPPPSTSPAPPNGKSPMNNLHSRHYSMLEKDTQQSTDDELKDLSKVKAGDLHRAKDLASGSLKWNSKPALQVKASSRGKSVRTIRPSKYTGEVMRASEACGNHVENSGEKTRHGVIDAGNMSKNDLKSGRIDDNLSVSSDKQKTDDYSPTKPKMAGHCRRDKQEYSENSVMGSKENSEIEAGNFDTNSDEEAASDIMSESGRGPSEVDKKAGEFIAKFREQIRLQKVSSFDRTQGLDIRNNLFR